MSIYWSQVKIAMRFISDDSQVDAVHDCNGQSEYMYTASVAHQTTVRHDVDSVSHKAAKGW